MIKFLKDLFTKTVTKVSEVVTLKKEVVFDSEVLKPFAKNFILNLEKFEQEWITGNGVNDYTKGYNYQWFGPESVVLVDDEIHINSIYAPNFFEDEKFEYRSGGIMSTRVFYKGYYEFTVELPEEGNYTHPQINILTNDGDTIELLPLDTNRGVTKVGCLLLDDTIEIYHDSVMISKENVITEGTTKVHLVNGRTPASEGVENLPTSVLKLKGLTFYRKR